MDPVQGSFGLRLFEMRGGLVVATKKALAAELSQQLRLVVQTLGYVLCLDR